MHDNYATSVSVPLSQTQLCPDRPREPLRAGISWDRLGRLHLDAGVVASLFEPLTGTVCRTLLDLRDQFSAAHTVFLVAAFANQRPLQRKVEELGLEVARPPRPELAVSIGGAQLGMWPTRIVSRFSRVSYGLQKSATTNLDRYPAAPLKRLRDGRVAVHGFFHVFQEGGSQAPEGSQVSAVFEPLEQDATKVVFNLFATPSRNAMFVTEPLMERVGQITVLVDDLHNSTKSIKVTFTSQATFIIVNACRQADNLELKTELEFFGVGEHEHPDPGPVITISSR